MLHGAFENKVLPSLGIGNVRIHTLQFADDLLIFFDGSFRSARVIKYILEAFSNGSGLKINFGKSSITPINLLDHNVTYLANLFGCPIQGFPLKYLGLPLSPRVLVKNDFLPIIEKIDKRLAEWKGSLLSRGGQLVLVNTVLSSIYCYFNSAFILPSWVIKAIDKVRRGFFWKGKILHNGFHCLANWDQLCRPIRVGGLGIRNIRSSNCSLILKGLWSFFHSKELPWVRLLTLKHYARRPLANSGSLPAGCCPIWKGMLSTLPLFSTSTSCSLGNGKSVSFWSARWSGESPLRYSFPTLFAASSSKHLSVHDWLRHFPSRPNLGFNLASSPVGQQELTLLYAKVATISLSSSSDSTSWRWSNDGLFSAKSAYTFLCYDGIDDRKIKHLWGMRILLKLKIFVWLALRYKLLTADRLAKRGWIGPTICSLCSAGGENLDYLLFLCPYARSVWEGCLSSWPSSCSRLLNTSGDVAGRWKAAREFTTGSSKAEFDCLFVAGCWEI